jgi:subtilisin family serine protease
MKNHLYFKNPQEGVTTFKQKSRYGGNSEESEENKDFEVNYDYKKSDFARSLNSFRTNLKKRKERKSIEVPNEINLIWIKFHNVFDSSKFEQEYYRDFGLEIVTYSNWNTEATFAIVNGNLFRKFISKLDSFVNEDNQELFNPNIIFIKEFDFLSTERRFSSNSIHENTFLNLTNLNNFLNESENILQSLLSYLDQKNIEYNYSENGNYIEIFNNKKIIKEIVDNFDIIHIVNSYASGIVKPNLYNQPQKGFGFDVISNEELPIIGIIDTGVENTTPLAPILINDDSFNITDTTPFIDEIDHGTAVAAIAALGNKLYPDHLGTHTADAFLLSIKVLNENQGSLFKDNVINLIRKANNKYGVQIFTLTLGYKNYKKYHEKVSEYSIALDKLSHELNILIFISIGNNRDLLPIVGPIINFPELYNLENSNLCSPAESMNNITVGAYSDNFENNSINRISHIGTTPAIYSRTFHYNWNLDIFKDKNGKINPFRINNLLFKPDIICHGGDFDTVLDPSTTGIKILSAQKGIFFNKDAGTSYSAPFAANLCARIINKYPALKNNMQIVKSLIINSSSISEPNENFDKISNHTIGNGIPNENITLNSNDDYVTLILDDDIYPENLKCYSLKLPGYLIDLEQTTQNIINISSTLCFSFEPNSKSEFTYCPIHMAFLLTDNLELENYEYDGNGKMIASNGINNNKISNIKLKNSWSQDYYFKSKPLSNVQKTTQKLTKKNLIKNLDSDGNIQVKLAINCKLHKLLNDIDKNKLRNTSVRYSLVMSIEELPYKNKTSGKLYSELSLLNNLESIIKSEIDNELEAEN